MCYAFFDKEGIEYMDEQFEVVTIRQYDTYSQRQVDELLAKEAIKRDANLDYTCGIFNAAGDLIATGSYFKNTLRCLAIDSRYQGYGLTNKIVTHLITEQHELGNDHIFLYTKSQYQQIFQDLGFHTIVHIQNQIVFMENKSDGFTRYLEGLKDQQVTGQRVAAIIMNANPFTLGHQFLVETAASQQDRVHLFVVREDVSEFPFVVRKRLIEQGVAHLTNVSVHDTNSYLISSATFPSYFQKDDDDVIRSQINVEAEIFTRVAKHLGITTRYVGSEPYSHVTALYNEGLKQTLESNGITIVEILRKSIDDGFISASKVRKTIKEEGVAAVKEWVPETTYRYLMSEEAKVVLDVLAQKEDVVHY